MTRFWVVGTTTEPEWFTRTGEVCCQRADGSFRPFKPPPRTAVFTKVFGSKNIAFVCHKPAVSWLVEANTVFLSRIDLSDTHIPWGTFDLRNAIQDIASSAEDVARTWARYCAERPMGLDWFVRLGLLNSVHLQSPPDPQFPHAQPVLRQFALHASAVPSTPQATGPSSHPPYRMPLGAITDGNHRPLMLPARDSDSKDEIISVKESPYVRPGCEPRGAFRSNGSPLLTPFSYAPPANSNESLPPSSIVSLIASPPISGVRDGSPTSAAGSALHSPQLEAPVDNLATWNSLSPESEGLVGSLYRSPRSEATPPPSIHGRRSSTSRRPASVTETLERTTTRTGSAASKEVHSFPDSQLFYQPTVMVGSARPELGTWSDDHHRGVQPQPSPDHSTSGRAIRVLQECGANSQFSPLKFKGVSPALELEHEHEHERELRNASFALHPSPHVQWPLTSSFRLAGAEQLSNTQSALGLDMAATEEPLDGPPGGSGGGDPRDCAFGGEHVATALAATTSSESTKSGAKKFGFLAKLSRKKDTGQINTNKVQRR